MSEEAHWTAHVHWLHASRTWRRAQLGWKLNHVRFEHSLKAAEETEGLGSKAPPQSSIRSVPTSTLQPWLGATSARAGV